VVAVGLLGIVLSMVGGVAVAGSVPLTGQARCALSVQQPVAGGNVRSGAGPRTFTCPRTGDRIEAAGPVLDPPDAVTSSAAAFPAPSRRCESTQERTLAVGTRHPGDLAHSRAPPTGTW
jgi:hypothetical protein